MITQPRRPGVGRYQLGDVSSRQPPKPASAMCFKTLLVLLATALLVGSGCATIEKDKRANALEAAMTAYGNAIRWGYYDTAYGFVSADERKGIPQHLDNIQVTGYEVVQPPFMKDEETAEQVARIEYVRKDVQRVRSLANRQLWRYEETTNRWWLMSGLPDFR
jgi:uncharacterized protein YceK